MSSLLARAERLLRWSEKYMKTDMVYLAKGGFWLMLGQAVSAAAGLLLAIGFANLLPSDVYGKYKFILSLAGIITTFTLTGMGTAVTQAVARGLEGVYRTGFWVQLKWSVFMMLVASGGATYYFLNGDRVVGFSLLIVGVSSPIIESASLYVAYLNGKKDFRAGARYGIVRSLIPVAAVLTTIFFTKDVVLIVLAFFLSHAVTSSVLYLWVLNAYRPAHEIDETNITYSKHVSFMNIVSTVASQADKILIFHYLGATQLAIYSIAFTIPGQLKIAVKTVTSLIFPKLSSATLETIRSSIYPKAARLLLGFSLIIGAYILIAPFIYQLIFPRYLAAIPLSQALAIGYLFSPALLFSETFNAQKKQREMYIAKIVTSALRILLLLILLPPFGVWGAVYTFILVNALSGALTLVLFHRLRE